LNAAEGKKIVEYLSDFSSLGILVNEVPIKGNDEPPRSIIGRAEALNSG
jgi:hypothetical protein